MATGDRRYLPARSASSFLGLGDDLLGDVLRAGGVVAELHGELAAAGGHGAEVADVAEHRAQRGLGLDADATGGRLLALDHAAAAVEVADDVTDVVVGSEDVELHDRLEDLRGGLGHRSGDRRPWRRFRRRWPRSPPRGNHRR